MTHENDFEIRRQYTSKSLCIIGGIIFIIIFTREKRLMHISK